MKKILLVFLLLSSLCFAKVPKRAVSAAHFTTEILLSIGAEKQMVGTAYPDNPILPSLKEKYDKIPILSMKNPTKEQFYAVKPDFLTGWDSTVQDKNLGPIKELEKNGVQVYIMKSLHSSDINLVFEDILNYGKIFNLEDNAKKVVNKMKADLAAVQKKLPKNKVKVFTYDSGDKTPFLVGGDSIGNTIITLAGGDNIFKNIKKAWADGNWEKVLVENPDIILIIDYGDQSAESKIKFLKEKSPIKDLKAVKNNKFVVIELADITAGIRNVDAIKKLAKAFHNITIK